MTFVLDASITACWLLPDETHAVATAALDRLAQEPAIVPTIWWYEMRNLLIACERRGRFGADRTAAALAVLADLPIAIEPVADAPELLDLARRHRLSVYDAAYLALARNRNLDLATLDNALAAAARAERVPLTGA
ncbi:MAG: type II toxin-antitoxin system VapC family toxin [Pseudomonadota bacterium]